MPWTAGEPIRISLLGQPKALEKHASRIVNARDGRQFINNYLPARSRDEQNAIRDLAHRAMDGRPPIDGPVELKFVAYMAIPASWSLKRQRMALNDQLRPTARPDLSNLVKLCEDAMLKIVIRDDSLITDCHLWKRFSDRPRILIEVRPLVWIESAE